MNISSEYWYPDTHGLKAKYWYKKERNATAAAEELKETAPRIKYHDGTKNRHILTINELNKNDSAEYIFKIIADHQTGKQLDLPGVTLVVTGTVFRLNTSMFCIVRFNKPIPFTVLKLKNFFWFTGFF